MHAWDPQSGGVLAPHTWASVAGRRMVDHQDARWRGGSRDALEGKGPRGPEAVRQAVGGGCQSCWGRLMSVTNTIEAATWR